MRKVLSVIWKMIKSNWVLKIMALLFAVILWSYVLAETNPVRERVVKDVVVQSENLDELTAKDLVISGGSLTDILGTVDVPVKVNQNETSYLNKENVEAYVDLSSINGEGEHKVEIQTYSQYGEALDPNPKYITLNIDKYDSNTVPVDVNVVGSVPEGYYAEEPEVMTDVVTIEGALTDVEKVVRAECNIDLTGLTERYNQSVDVVLYDSDGNVIDSSLFADSVPSVIVTVDVLAMKTVEVSVEGAVLGQEELASGYEVTDITVEPETVQIVGEQEVLDGIELVGLVPISVNNAYEDIITLLEYQEIDGVSILGEDKAQVSVTIREITESKEFGDVPITVKNVSAGLLVEIEPEDIDVTVIAGVNKLPSLDKANIVPYVDLEGLEEGVYNLSVLFEVPEGFAAENFTPETSTVTVTITEE